MCLFFQAEDGIRDLVRSRGLGDVYKRQTHRGFEGLAGNVKLEAITEHQPQRLLKLGRDRYPVSYTHLTLPTSDLV